jgi:hypothetical protein
LAFGIKKFFKDECFEFRIFSKLPGQMVDHGADFFDFEGFINKTIDPQVDRFLEEGIPSL